MLTRWLLLVFFSVITQSLLGQIHNPEFKKLIDSNYQHAVPLISIEEFMGMGKNNLFVLDTREKEEYVVSHLKNSRHAGYLWFDMRNLNDIPQDAVIVLYCSIGIRSEKIGKKLIKAGYKNVYNLYGGIFEWINQGNPIYRTNGSQTTEIHGFNKEWSKWLEHGSIVL